MKLVGRQRKEDPRISAPFPIHMYLVGVSDEGDELLRLNLDAAFTAYGQTLNLSDLGPFELSPDSDA